jgi:hypothetical protein
MAIATAQSVKQHMHIIIMRKEERTCGKPKMALKKMGQNSEKEPAGSR